MPISADSFWCWMCGDRYREAKAVVAKESRSGNDSKPRKLLTLQLRRKPHNKPRLSELVFLNSSPNYCEANPSTGSLGVVGRRCNRTSTGNWQININIKGDFRSLLYMVWRTSSGGLQTLFSLFCNRCWWLQPALLWTGVQHPPVQPRLPSVQLQIPLVLRSQVPDLHHQERRVHLQIKLRELFTRRLYNLGLINLW